MIRTRAITDRLPYDDLVKRSIIPDLFTLTSQSTFAIATKKYPPFVYKSQEYSFFGMFMDYIIRAGLRINLHQDVELGVDPCTESIQRLQDDDMMEMMSHISNYETSNNINCVSTAALALTSSLYGTAPYTPGEIQSYIPTMVNIIKEIIAKWNMYSTYLNGSTRFNTEYSYGAIASHPDIVTDQTVLDIKTTGSFLKMSRSSCLQVLAYYAMIKQTTPDIKYVGFVLPMQRDLILYDVSNWDPTSYLELLSDEATKLAAGNDHITVDNGDGTMSIEALMIHLGIPQDEVAGIIAQMNNGEGQPVIPQVIGSHISKGKNIATTLKNFTTKHPGVPCQMFLASPRSGKKDAKTACQIAAAAQVIRETGLLYFTHAPYVINLCSNVCDEKGDYWMQRYLNDDLIHTVAMGGKGVVVHTGARKHLPEPEALCIMEHMVRTALPYATEECPLLLETPCGEGTEIVTKIEELGNFFLRFTVEERKKLGLCADSCHIFADNYDPLEYLQHWDKYCPVPIKLVHFNDSQTVKGSHVDRHASPGHGHIGLEKMNAIAEWCVNRSIPMVRE